MKKVIVFAILILSCINLEFIQKIQASTFTLPSNGYIGWRYYDNTNGKEGINGTYHTGIDIWSNKDGNWNNGIQGQSNAIYAASSGQVVYANTSTEGVMIKHSNSLYTKYWHVRNQQVNSGDNVTQNSIIGYQDYNVAVHVHVTVASSIAGYDADYTLDPSSYFGMQLDVRQPGVLPFGTQVTRGITCGGTDVIITQNIPQTFPCTASHSIKILPETRLTGEEQYYIH